MTPLVSKRLIKSRFFFNRAENMNKKTAFEKVLGMWFYKTKDVPCGSLPQKICWTPLVSAASFQSLIDKLEEHQTSMKASCLIWIVTHWCVNCLRAPARCSHTYNEMSLETAVFSQGLFGNWIAFFTYLLLEMENTFPDTLLRFIIYFSFMN